MGLQQNPDRSESLLPAHLEWVQQELDLISKSGLRRFRRALKFCPDGNVLFRGRKLVNFASSDYLAFSRHPEVIDSVSSALYKYGVGAGASPLVSGYTQLHRNLEKCIARWEGFDQALVFSSGFGANLGTIGALVHPKDLILSDSLNHASIVDGCRLSRATLRFFRHRDCDHLEDLIFQAKGGFRRLWIVSDTIFSMDGDFAPLESLHRIAEKHNGMLIIDEAHATGVVGSKSRGLTDFFSANLNWRERVVKVGTLSKALASQGGFVCANNKIINLIKNKARSYIFSTSLSPVCASAALAAIRLINCDNRASVNVCKLSQYLRENLIEMGLDIGSSSSHIIPVIFGDAEKTISISKALINQGFLVPAIRPPSVPLNSSRLRISVNAFHNSDLIDRFILSFKSVLRDF